MKARHLLPAFCPLLVFLLALAGPAAAQDDNHDHVYTGSTAYYLAEHGDFDIGFEEGQLELHIHLHAGTIVDGQPLAEDTLFEPSQLIIAATQDAETDRPEGDLWEPTGVGAGEPMWVLPQHEQEGLPAFGISTEEVDGGVFVDDLVTLTLRYIQGPGDFSLWESDAFGSPTFLLATHGQIMATTVPIGGHAHYNWGFTASGEYTLVFEVSGELVAGGSLDALSVYTFTVTDKPLRFEPLSSDVNDDGVVDEHDLQIVEQDLGRTALVWPNADNQSDDQEGILARLLIGDAEESHLSVIDLEHGQIHQSEYSLSARATGLYASPSGRFAVSVETDGDQAGLFDGGIYAEDHGDHVHYYEKALTRMNLSLQGSSPVHMVARGQWMTLHYDGIGKVSLIK